MSQEHQMGAVTLYIPVQRADNCSAVQCCAEVRASANLLQGVCSLKTSTWYNPISDVFLKVAWEAYTLQNKYE